MNIWDILEYTTAISVVGLLILGTKRIFHDKLDARWHYFIWIVLLVRMVVPLNFDLIRTPLSIFQQFPVDKWFEMGKIVVQKKGYEDLFEIFGKVYLIGAVALAVYYLLTWLVLRVKIAGAAKANEETVRYVQEIATKYQLKCCKNIRICRSSTPFIFGVVSPILVLPENNTNPKEPIIVHELLHMRCKDVLINLGLHVVRVINWFNPLVWMLAAVVQNDSEALCDQRVLERCGQEKMQDYGEMLIAMTAGKGRNPAKIGTSNMASSYQNMKTRIQRIRDFRMVPVGIGFVTFCITLMLVVAGIGSSAAGAGTLKVPLVKSERDLEWGLLCARCYCAETPQQAIYLFLRAAKERNLFYRMAVMPLEHVEGYENFAKICLSGAEKGDYGSVETWEEEAYSPYFPRQMFGGLEAFRIYNLQHDETSGSATVYVALGSEDSKEAYAEWKLQLIKENGWKVWIEEETDKPEGEYEPEALIYGSTQLGDFKAEVLAYNEGVFSSLNQQTVGITYHNDYAEEETFPEFFSMEVKSTAVYVSYTGGEDLTGHKVRIETASSKEEIENVSLMANLMYTAENLLIEAQAKAEETGDEALVEEAKMQAEEIMTLAGKIASGEELNEGEMQSSWSSFTYESSSSSDGSGYNSYDGVKLMDGERKLLTGGGSGYSEPGYGWSAEDQISAYVKIYIDGELVEEGQVWSKSH